MIDAITTHSGFRAYTVICRIVAVNFTRKNPHIRNWSGMVSLVPSPLFSPHSNLRLVGKVKPIIRSVFPFDHVLKGYDRILTAEAVGKGVIGVSDDSRRGSSYKLAEINRS